MESNNLTKLFAVFFLMVGISNILAYRALTQLDHRLELYIEAPETLYMPQRDDFTNEESYRAALDQYWTDGNWASD